MIIGERCDFIHWGRCAECFKSSGDDKMSSVSKVGAKEALLVNLFVNPNVAAYQGCSLVVFTQEVVSEEIVDMSCEGS